jgi:hypothetical protein
MAPEVAPPAKHQPAMLSELESEIIRACIRYQGLTMLDLWHVLGRSFTHTYLRRVLMRLSGTKDRTAGQYLFKFALPKTTWGAPKFVYVPGVLSRDIQFQEGDASGQRFTPPATIQGYSYSFLYHNLFAVRLAIVAELFVRRHPSYTLAELRLWHDMAANPPRVRLSTQEGVTEASVIPDVFIFLQRLTDGGGRGIWFEVDNSTTYRVAVFRRLRARLAFLKSANFEKYFGTPAVVLAFVVITKDPKRRAARLQSLACWIDEFLDREFLDQEKLDEDDSVAQQNKEQWASIFRLAALDYETLYEHVTGFYTGKLWYPPGRIDPDTKPTLSLLPSPKVTENTHADNNAPSQDNHEHPSNEA